MKIVFVNPVGAIGGGERVLLTIFAALLNTKPDIQLHLIVGTDGLLIDQAEKLGVQVKLLKLPAELNQLGDSAFKGSNKAIAGLILLLRLIKILPSIGEYLREFKRSLCELKPDLIHSNGIKTHLLTALAGVKGIPVVWHIHDFYGSRPFMAKILNLKRVSYGVKQGIAISQAVAQDAQATIPSLPIEVIYNAVDVNYFSPTSPTSHLTLRVGLVATFARWKGHDIFLEAASEIIKNHPHLNVRFCIVGGAIYKTRGSQFSEQELKDKAADLDIVDKVDFLGFQENIAEIYRSLDIVVHASTQPEPFGLAIVEAMACGKPVIVSQAGGAAELFTHNYDAVGVPPGETIALATAILDLLNNPEKRQIISENARHTITERFSHERLGEQLMKVYMTNI
ncbi:glycosyltransferase family 4 protein [Trichormus variabilis]|uniref:Glycosyl transferase n=1 Tax=Trichormus variabilis SAG 1403-4b TaxID=447716 RepID=A0A3S1ICN0_ANAVA|nr:glycosyltransferase family 4 protein [Trichormus variabilis]MBD2626914.1 glycosyltransferase family 4 protein [Trichormus variabilis FACHB-164]RUS95417.1 glycosyl transferase [Trichormus variabilis SAG 1403-4b]